MDPILKINNTIAFLNRTEPEALLKLQKQFPGHKDLLAGREIYGAENNADTADKQKALLLATVQALGAIITEAAPLQNSLRKKLTLAKNVRLAASILSVFSSTVLVVLIGKGEGQYPLKIIVACVNLLTAALPLVAGSLRSSKYDDKKDIAEMLQELNSLIAESKFMGVMLKKDLELNNYDNDTVDYIKKADSLFGKLSAITEQLG